MKPLRVVVDPNVFVSILIGGSVALLKDRLFSNAVELILSKKLLTEMHEQATKTKFSKYFTPAQARSLIDLLIDVGTTCPDSDSAKGTSRDPDDDYLLALCKHGKADVLLTGDDDLLVLKKYGRTRILNPAAFRREHLRGK